MKVKSIKNPQKDVAWDLRASIYPLKTQLLCRSKKQYAVGQYIRSKYPLDVLLEDVTIPDTRLSLDFYLPQRKIAVEVQGEQHFEFNPFFHETNSDFHDQQDRDLNKQLFCELNNIDLIVVKNLDEIKKIWH